MMAADLIIGWSIGFVQAQAMGTNDVVFASADKATFKEESSITVLTIFRAQEDRELPAFAEGFTAETKRIGFLPQRHEDTKGGRRIVFLQLRVFRALRGCFVFACKVIYFQASAKLHSRPVEQDPEIVV